MKAVNYLVNSYARLDIQFDYGKGVWLFDKKGQKYLDAISGIGVNALGHNHKKITKTIEKQSKKFIHLSNLYPISAQEKLAMQLCQIAHLDGAFFCNSGAEAIECALKITRIYAKNQNYANTKVIVFDGSFHGRTFGALSATINKKIRTNFEPLLTGFLTAKFNDLASVEKIFKQETQIAAVLIEPIQGERGIRIADDSFLQALRKLCNQHNCLLILDEIQSGFARTGNWFFAHKRIINADILTLAKPLAAGLPIGACLVNHKANLIAQGQHGSTFGGNPLACKVATKVIKIIEKENLLINIAQRAKQLKIGLESIFNEDCFDLRMRGLMIGIQINQTNNLLAKNIHQLTQNALNLGLLINVTSGNVIRLLPPYIINEMQVNILLDKLKQLKQKYLLN